MCKDCKTYEEENKELFEDVLRLKDVICKKNTETERLQRKIAELEGAGEKEPFPELEDIEWVKLKAAAWFPEERYNPNEIRSISISEYEYLKAYHENSKDFTVTWKTLSKDDIECENTLKVEDETGIFERLGDEEAEAYKQLRKAILACKVP